MNLPVSEKKNATLVREHNVLCTFSYFLLHLFTQAYQLLFYLLVWERKQNLQKACVTGNWKNSTEDKTEMTTRKPEKKTLGLAE